MAVPRPADIVSSDFPQTPLAVQTPGGELALSSCLLLSEPIERKRERERKGNQPVLETIVNGKGGGRKV